MRAIIKELHITCFKGISNLHLNFDEKETFILGRNGSGKTTISDAYHWLLLGKNSQDAKEFEIKPIDTDGKRAQRHDIEVSAVIIIDGERISLRRVQSEIWSRPQGQQEQVFKGNETKYFYNDVPCKQKEYQDKINAIIPEDKLKLFTNTEYFNYQLKWQERRAVLIQMAGDVNDQEIIDSNKNYQFINNILSQRKSLEEFKKEIAVKKRKTKEELELIPARIDEVKRSASDLQRPFGRIREDKTNAESELSKVEEAINDRNKAYQQQEEEVTIKRKKKYEHQTAAETIKNAYLVEITVVNNKPDGFKIELEERIADNKKKLTTTEYNISILNGKINQVTANIDKAVNDITLLSEKVAEYRRLWDEENKKEFAFDDNLSCCPTCKRELEPEDILTKQEEMQAAFNSEKSEKLNSIVAKANRYKNDISDLEESKEKYSNENQRFWTELTEYQSEVTLLKDQILNDQEQLNAHLATKKEPFSIETQLAIKLEEDKEYQDLLLSIQQIEDEISEFKPVNNTELIAQKSALQEKINAFNKDLLNEEVIKNATQRLQELYDRESILNQEIANLEGQEFHLQQFTLTKMNRVEDAVNSMFDMVKFRLFDTQINGGIIEVCDCLIDGVPYSDANTASKINAGLDIINALSRKYDIYAPVFIDGRESITDIIPTETQVINLVVSPRHNQLTVMEQQGAFA